MSLYAADRSGNDLLLQALVQIVDQTDELSSSVTVVSDGATMTGEQAERDQAAAEAEVAKQAILDRLGLTAEEAKMLLS